MTAAPQPPAPALAELQCALRRITEYLAHELARPGTQAPQWPEGEWRIARAVAAVHGVSGLLSQRLRWRGPEDWHRFLADQEEQVRQRQPRIEALLRALEAGAREADIALIALKGAALLARGCYASGERPMADIDLLVNESQEVRAQQLLAQLGFAAGTVTWKHRAFEEIGGARVVAPLGEHRENPLKIELHCHVREMLPLRPVDISALVFAGEPRAGLNGYPTHAAMLLHVLLHASCAMLWRTARLLHLNDIARLTSGMGSSDWEAFFAAGQRTADPSLWWAFPPLALTDRYFHCIPAAVLSRLAQACRWPLRRAARRHLLADVSLSHLWVSAFPGIEWSRSLGEAGAYALQRLRPDAATRALRGEFAASQPLISGGEWAHTSQRRRMVRWLVSRQPRQEALQPVRAALAARSSAASP